MKRQHQKGFTMMELLIVVAIIGILAAVGIPMYYNYTERGYRASFVSHGRSIYRSFIAFYLEYDMYPNATVAGSEPWQAIFNKGTLEPVAVDFDVPIFANDLAGGQADAYDSPDNPTLNGEFYLWFTSRQYPKLRLLVSQSDEIAGVPVEDQNLWLDGVFVYFDGARM